MMRLALLKKIDKGPAERVGGGGGGGGGGKKKKKKGGGGGKKKKKKLGRTLSGECGPDKIAIIVDDYDKAIGYFHPMRSGSTWLRTRRR